MRRLLIMAAAAGIAQNALAEPNGSKYALRDITVVDVANGRLVPGRTVLIDGDRITAVGPAAEVTAEGDITIVDGSGLYVMPGLCDAHVHFSASPETYGPLMLAHGVTLVRDLGGPTEFSVQLRNELRSGKTVGPEMIVTGAIIDGTPPVWPFSEACDTEEEARAAVRKLKEAGVDQIKVYQRLKPEVYRAAIEEAHALGLLAVGHIPSAVSVEDAIAAGQNEVEHLTGLGEAIAAMAPETAERRGIGHAGLWGAWARLPEADPAQVDALVERISEAGMVQCPTLVVIQGIGRVGEENVEDPRLKYVPEGMRLFWMMPGYETMSRGAADTLPHMQAFVGKLHAAGVPILAGTDLANPYVFAGSSLHDELAMMQDAGIPAPEVLKTAITRPIDLFGLDDRLGAVEPGKRASLVLLRADPLVDVRNAAKIEGVFHAGKYYDGEGIAGLLAKAEKSAFAPKPVEDDRGDLLALPGEEIARGAYALRFMQWDAGTEEYVLTKDGEVYRLAAHISPKGGPQPPMVVTAEFVPGEFPRRVTYRTLTDPVTEATYSRRGDKLHIEATDRGKPLSEETLGIPDGATLAIPAYCGEMIFLSGTPLRVGETRELSQFSFGFRGTAIDTSMVRITREADETITLVNGSETRTRRYKTQQQTPMGEISSDLWTDELGLPLKVEMRSPWGQIKAERR